MSHLRLVHTAPLPQHRWRFTSHDLLALSAWMRQSDAHGYGRVLIESGTAASAPEDGGYALLYAQGRAWANWGLARNGDSVSVWHCGSGVDLGRFPTMIQALESLPPVWVVPTQKRVASIPADPRSNVVRLAPAGRFKSGAMR